MCSALRFASIAIIVLWAANAQADRIRVAVQKTGTLAWEIDVIKRHGIDRKLGLAIETVELASTEAGKVALKGGSADIMLSDWLWVARERSLGDTLVFYPASSALGAVMAPAQSSIRSVLDLKKKKLAVAGGPLDKSWLLLQAFARRASVDLRKEATIVYGAPPLLSQKALQGETDATLTYWNFCADLESRGFSRAIAMESIVRDLGAKGPIAIIGLPSTEAAVIVNQDHFLYGNTRGRSFWPHPIGMAAVMSTLRINDANALANYRQRYSGVLSGVRLLRKRRTRMPCIWSSPISAARSSLPRAGAVDCISYRLSAEQTALGWRLPPRIADCSLAPDPNLRERLLRPR